MKIQNEYKTFKDLDFKDDSLSRAYIEFNNNYGLVVFNKNIYNTYTIYILCNRRRKYGFRYTSHRFVALNSDMISRLMVRIQKLKKPKEDENII